MQQMGMFKALQEIPQLRRRGPFRHHVRTHAQHITVPAVPHFLDRFSNALDIKPDNVKESLTLGKEYTSELVASIGDLDPEDLGVEFILTEQNAKGEHHIVALYDFKLVSFVDGVATWRTTIVPEFSGTFESAGRLYARNPNMPHRQDLELVKWL